MLRITEDTMTAHPGPATAKLLAVVDGWQRWEVSWLPTPVDGRNRAVTAMMLADHILAPGADLQAPAVKGWAAELHLNVDVATRLIQEAAYRELGLAEHGVTAGEMRAIFGEPVEGRDWEAAPRRQATWEDMRPEDFGQPPRRTAAALPVDSQGRIGGDLFDGEIL